MARTRITGKPSSKRRGDLLPPLIPPVPPPPPVPCDLGAYCAAIKELMDALAAAASGSMIVMGDDGHIRIVPPPVANSRWCWNAATGEAYWQPE